MSLLSRSLLSSHTLRREVIFPKRATAAIVAVVVLIAVFVPATPVAADHAGRGIDEIKVEPARRYNNRGSWDWYRGSGGGTGSDGFYYTWSWDNSSNTDTYAIWNVVTWPKALRGQYKLKVFVPRNGARPEATATRVRYRVQEKQSGGSWRTIKTYALNQQTSKGMRVFRNPVTVNGEVRILVRDNESEGGRIAIDSITFVRHSHHREDIEIAIAACKQDVNIRLWLARESYARECQYKYTRHKWAWIPRPRGIDRFLSDLHDSKGRAVPKFIRNIADIITGSLMPPGRSLQETELEAMSAARRTEVTDALLERWPRGVYK